MKKTTIPKNKVLSSILEKIEDARKNNQKSVVAFLTNRSHHKATVGTNGVTVNDLKPVYKEAYVHLLTNHNVDTKLVSMEDWAVEWIVKLS